MEEMLPASLQARCVASRSYCVFSASQAVLLVIRVVPYLRLAFDVLLMLGL